MDTVSISELADMIIIIAGFGFIGGVVISAFADIGAFLYEKVKNTWKKRKERKLQ